MGHDIMELSVNSSMITCIFLEMMQRQFTIRNLWYGLLSNILYNILYILYYLGLIAVQWSVHADKMMDFQASEAAVWLVDTHCKIAHLGRKVHIVQMNYTLVKLYLMEAC